MKRIVRTEYDLIHTFKRFYSFHANISVLKALLAVFRAREAGTAFVLTDAVIMDVAKSVPVQQEHGDVYQCLLPGTDPESLPFEFERFTPEIVGKKILMTWYSYLHHPEDDRTLFALRASTGVIQSVTIEHHCKRITLTNGSTLLISPGTAIKLTEL